MREDSGIHADSAAAKSTGTVKSLHRKNREETRGLQNEG